MIIMTKNLKTIIGHSFSKQLSDIYTMIEYAQNVIRVSSGLNMLPMDLSITINHAASELAKSSNRAIINHYRKHNQDIFVMLPDLCDSFVAELILDDAGDSAMVEHLRSVVRLGFMAGIIH